MTNQVPLTDEQPSVGMENYIARISELSKSAEALIPIALGLIDLEEWKAFREILKIKIAQQMYSNVYTKGTSEEKAEDRGFIRGMDFPILLLEKFLPEAMEKKKASLLRKVEKNNDLTDPQA